MKGIGILRGTPIQIPNHRGPKPTILPISRAVDGQNPAPISHREYHMSYSVLTRPILAHYIGSLEYKILGHSVY